MAILRAANSLWVNAVLFAAILLVVILMPIVDRHVCRKLGISLQHGMGTNPKMDHLLKLRQLVLYLIFLIYFLANLYLVFFSRASGSDYSVHIAPFNDIGNSVRFDSGFAECVSKILSGDIKGFMAQLHVVKLADILQATMNIMLYIPMGYLLPYVFRWFRKNRRRTVIVCFLCSALTENMQLIFKRGCYDFDDLFFNTFGGIIGIMLYLSFAYAVTHPSWRKDLQSYRRFRRHSSKTALSRLAKQMDCGRVTLPATQEEEIYSFFVEKLGFRLRGQSVSENSNESTLLLKLGGLYIEFLCSNRQEELPKQKITLSVERLERVRKRLVKKGIEVSDYFPDPYTNHRSMYITGPDNIQIVFQEY